MDNVHGSRRAGPVLVMHHQDTSRCVPMDNATGHRCMGMCRLVLVAYARTSPSAVQPNMGCSRSVCCTTAWADKVYIEIYVHVYIHRHIFLYAPCQPRPLCNKRTCYNPCSVVQRWKGSWCTQPGPGSTCLYNVHRPCMKVYRSLGTNAPGIFLGRSSHIHPSPHLLSSVN